MCRRRKDLISSGGQKLGVSGFRRSRRWKCKIGQHWFRSRSWICNFGQPWFRSRWWISKIGHQWFRSGWLICKIGQHWFRSTMASVKIALYPLSGTSCPTEPVLTPQTKPRTDPSWAYKRSCNASGVLMCLAFRRIFLAGQAP
jgi:hypothetical protein